MSNAIQSLWGTTTRAEPARRTALERIARREIAFVYTSALRQTHGDTHLAEDITQAVFIVLARKPHLSLNEAEMRNWLFVTTRYAAKNAMKIQSRRRFHERSAAAENSRRTSLSNNCESLREQLSPMLDEGLAKLSCSDRAGLLLSFFDEKTYREVGAALGVSEEAARKRVSRAIEKMRAFFASRGVMIDSAASAGAMSSVLRASAGSVPSALANSVLDAALAASHASAAGSSITLANGVSKMFIYAKLKLAASVLVASLILGASGVALFAQARDDKKSVAPANESSVANFDDGIVVECLGIRQIDGEKWWYPDGSPSAHSCDPATSINEPPHTHQLLFRVTGVPQDAGIVYWFGRNSDWSSEEARRGGAPIAGAITMTFPADERGVLDITCMVAAGEWESVLNNENLTGSTGGAGKHGGVIFSPTIDAPNPMNNNQPGALATVSHDVSAYQSRVVGIDDNGVEHIARNGNGMKAGAVQQNQYYFDLSVERLRTISFQVRPYDHRATFTNMTLDPAKKTDVKIKVEKD